MAASHESKDWAVCPKCLAVGAHAEVPFTRYIRGKAIAGFDTCDGEFGWNSTPKFVEHSNELTHDYEQLEFVCDTCHYRSDDYEEFQPREKEEE